MKPPPFFTNALCVDGDYLSLAVVAPGSSLAASAAARRATGIRFGEQDM